MPRTTALACAALALAACGAQPDRNPPALAELQQALSCNGTPCTGSGSYFCGNSGCTARDDVSGGTCCTCTSASLGCGSDCGTCATTNASSTSCQNNTSPSTSACLPVCNTGFKDTNGNGADGCEICQTNSNCGTDCAPCSLTNASSTSCQNNASLSTLACLPVCNTGYKDTDSNGADGCEICKTNSNCGTDCAPCSLTNAASTSCQNNTSLSTLACLPVCNTGYKNTNGNGADGCEICQTNSNCGTDCAPCALTNASSTSCQNNTSLSTLACLPVCNTGYKNTNGNGADGCEICKTNSNCGTDCAPCTLVGASSTSCQNNTSLSSSACLPVCSAGYKDTDSNGADGCEICKTNSNCGTDCAPCSLTNASSTSCQNNTSLSTLACLPVCNTGYKNTNGNGADGCEICQTNSNCGTDCAPCLQTNASSTSCQTNASLSSVACLPVCKSGYKDTDGNAADGCEICKTNLNCGTDCAPCLQTNASSTSCQNNTSLSSLACLPVCNTGYKNTDGNGADGCEICKTNLNCGTDCAPCLQTNASSTSCQNNTSLSSLACLPVCNTGYKDTDGNGADGCESCSTAAACGSDCLACGVQNANPTCNGNGSPGATSCVRNCKPSWYDKNGDATDGCEAPCNDASHCGTDCLQCNSSNTSSAPSCSSTSKPAAQACVLPCASGYINADNDPTNGCETQCTSPTYCGSDCKQCKATNASPTCGGNINPAATSCVLNCAAGYYDKDGDPTTGCEAACNDTTHCGSDCLACGSPGATCSGNTLPAAQSCHLNCPSGWADADGDPSNGCEKHCTDTSYCGSDCKACGSQHTSAAPSCSGATNPAATSCAVACAAGWANVNSDGTDGCEAQCNLATRCGSDCKACGTQNASPTCAGNSAPAASSCLRNCSPGWADVNGDYSDGCEGKCDNAARCGSDCLPCGNQHTTVSPTCAGNTLSASASCQLACAAGFANANGDPSDGCEATCNTATLCGSDCKACGIQHASPTCSGSATPAAQSCQLHCAAGWADVDGDPTNGCETPCTTTTRCGTDCKACGSQNASPACSGNLTAAAAACTRNCSPGYVDLDLDPTNGCEASCSTAAHCGSDCKTCGSQHTSTAPTCAGNTAVAATSCQLTCLTGFSDADHDPTNGCEYGCQTPDTCGSDCKPCGSQHTSSAPTCAGNNDPAAITCQLTCSPGWRNNDNDPTNGCETECKTLTLCGSDCLACGTQHATAACNGSTLPAKSSCQLTCNSGWADADADPSTGCEAACDQITRCGLECKPCDKTHATSVACSGNTAGIAAACQPTCQPGYLNLDGNGTNGCEATCDQPDHCGPGCIKCPDQLHSTASCSGATGACTYQCNPGWVDVDPYTDGCETECNTPDRCGGDCKSCPAKPANALPTCSGNDVLSAQACGIACSPGYQDKNSSPADGCEACADGYYDAAQKSPIDCEKCEVDAHCGTAGPNLCVDCSKSADGAHCMFGRCGCTTDSDCPGTTNCREHTCVVVCLSDSDCPDTERCCGPDNEKACVVFGDEVCDGKDNDCDGVIDDHLTLDDAPLCDNQQGVCAGSHWACVQGLFQPCNADTYAAYSPDYEASETRCDGKDNDCNGLTDEPAACERDAGAIVVSTPDAAAGPVLSHDLGGCGCATTGAPLWALGLALAALAARRRRR